MEFALCFLNAFLLVFFAEMGDKTQLLVMALSSKYKFRDIILGVAVAVFFLNIIAVTLGSFIHSLIPENIIKLCAGILFLVFALISLCPESDAERKSHALTLSPTLAVSSAFFMAELGDKTQVTTMTLAAQYHMNDYSAYFLVFLGSFIAMLFANIIALAIGKLIGKCIPDSVFRVVSVVIFTIFGFIAIYEPISTYTENYLMPKILFSIGLLYIAIAWNIIRHNKRKWRCCAKCKQ